jgi:hypothetical protein
MTSRIVTLPELGIIAGTRVAMGVGIGLLLADHFLPTRKRTIAWTLITVGVLTTIPLAAAVLLSHDPRDPHCGCEDDASSYEHEMASSRQ